MYPIFISVDAKRDGVKEVKEYLEGTSVVIVLKSSSRLTKFSSPYCRFPSNDPGTDG